MATLMRMKRIVNLDTLEHGMKILWYVYLNTRDKYRAYFNYVLHYLMLTRT